jgi:hypothetical protein
VLAAFQKLSTRDKSYTVNFADTDSIATSAAPTIRPRKSRRIRGRIPIQ